jgi:hypothetical protein
MVALQDLEAAIEAPMREPLERKRANRTRTERGRHQRRVKRAPDPRPADGNPSKFEEQHEASTPVLCCYCDQPAAPGRFVCVEHARVIEQRARELRARHG